MHEFTFVLLFKKIRRNKRIGKVKPGTGFFGRSNQNVTELFFVKMIQRVHERFQIQFTLIPKCRG
jgi:hypothetical protein